MKKLLRFLGDEFKSPRNRTEINAGGGTAWGDVADVREYDAVGSCMASAARRFGLSA
jgi:hypothetical protein